jgi:hypothetical protein
VLSNWADFRAILGIALVPVGGWLVMAVVVGLTFGHAYNSETMGAEFANQALGKFEAGPWASAVAMFSSLVAGLGYQVSGVTEGAPRGLALMVAPIGSLAVLAILARYSARYVFRRRPPATVIDMFVRITVAAALAAALIYVISAVAILLFANKGEPPAIPPTSYLPASMPDQTMAAGPVPLSLLLVLFPTLWIGTALGVFSLAPARAFMRSPFNPKGSILAIWNWLSPTWVAIRAYVIAVLVLSVVLVAGIVVWLFAASPYAKGADHPDIVTVLLAVPALLAMAPNILLTLALAATGQSMDWGYGGSSVMRGNLWRADGWGIAAGLLALTLPALIAGFWVRVRKPGASPAQVIVAGAGVWLVGILGAVVGAPAIRQSFAPVNAEGLTNASDLLAAQTGSFTMHLVSDLTQAILVGGLVVIAAMLLGFMLGGIRSTPPAPQAAGWVDPSRSKAAAGSAPTATQAPAKAAPKSRAKAPARRTTRALGTQVQPPSRPQVPPRSR